MSALSKPLVLAAALATAATVSAHRRQEPPVRSGIELARVDFAALAPDGEVVADLSATNVTLKIDGRPREIRSFQFVRLAGRSAVAPPTTLPAPFGTNALDDNGRTILLVFATDSIRANVIQQATDAAREFVGGLSPRDWVGVVTMPYGGALVEPTRNHDRVLKVLPTITGQASQQSTDSDKSCRTRDTLTALAGQLSGMAHVEGPKTIVFVSSGLQLPTRDAALDRAPGPCEVKSQHYDEVGKAATLARANLYVVRPDDLVIDSGRNAFLDPTASRFRSTDAELAGAESLAGVAHGVLLRLTPTDRSAFARIARESAGYYLVGFEPRASERNGSFRRVEVEVARSGVRIDAHPSLVLPKTDAKPAALTPQAMLRDAMSHRDLPLRVVGVAVPEAGDARLKILAMLEPLDRTATLASAAFGLIDARGRLVAQWTANAGELGSVPVLAAGLASPGHYRLRGAAIDTAGRRGLAEYELVAETVTAGPLTLSGLVLGVSYQKAFLPKLQFVAEPTAAAHVEILGVPPPGALTVAVELATTEDGPALVRVPGTIVQGTDPERRRAAGVVPVGGLQPGDYLVRVVLSVEGRPIGRVTRVLRKATA